MKINGKDYKFPEQLGEFMWDSMYHDHLFMHDGMLDKQELVNLLEEKLKPVWDAERVKVHEDGWESGFNYGYSQGERQGWTDGYSEGSKASIDPHGIGDSY